MHVISHTKIDFLRFWLSTFFLLEESWRKNGKVNRPCMFCISGFIHLDGIGEKPCDEHRESNSNNVFQPKIILFF